MRAEPGVIPVGQEPPPLTPTRRKADEPPKRTRGGNHRKAGDRFGVLNAFVDAGMAGLSRAEIAVWLVLWRDTRDGVARAGQASIARRAGVNRRTVYRTIQQLKRRGLLAVAYRGGLGRGVSAYLVWPVEPAGTHGT